jgi:hypothetical protein
MANYFIPNSTLAIGQTSTPWSRQSRRQNSASASFFAALSLTKTVRPRTLSFFNVQRSTLNAQRSIQTVGRWMLDVERWTLLLFGRVKGAWWSSRSSKPLSVPHIRDRGRFDSYPLRLNNLRIVECGLRSKNPARFNAVQSAVRDPPSAIRKEVTTYVA